MALIPLIMVLDHSIWYKTTLTSERNNRRDFFEGTKKIRGRK